MIDVIPFLSEYLGLSSLKSEKQATLFCQRFKSGLGLKKWFTEP